MKERFPRFFQLCERKDGLVKEMGRWVNGVWQWEVRWMRGLFDREREGESKFFEFLQAFNLREGTDDQWLWGDKGDRSYSVREVYELIMESSSRRSLRAPPREILRCIWKAYGPLKAKITAWRLAWNRLATADNVARRINLDLENK